MVNINLSEITSKLKTKAFYAQMYRDHQRFWWTMGLASAFATARLAVPGLSPEIILGGIPIYNVQKQGHAASDEMLKYRAMGGVFLAHQKGGNRTFHFTAKAFGPQRLFLIRILESLQWSGRERAQLIGDSVADESLEVSAILEYADEKKATLKAVEGAAAKSTLVVTKYTEEYDGYEREEYAYHKTIPIITDSKIYTNMYLETLVYREDIRLGFECIEIRCAFRQYLPPTNLNIMDTKYSPKEQEELADMLETLTGEDFLPQSFSKYYYQMFITEEEMSDFKRNEMAINLAWGTRTLFNEFVLNGNLQQKEKDMYSMEATTLALLTAPYIAYIAIRGK